jgi:CRISPR type III-B/RAMP module RAMP protein Cmr1
MESLNYTFSLLTDTFAHGAYQTMNFNRPELRAPSIKGMIRWWHEALGHSSADARTIFGHVSDRRNGIEGNNASRVMFRVQAVTNKLAQSVEFMPHKGQRGGSKSAILPEASFSLRLIQRREQLPSALWQQVQQATNAWMLMGGIGQKSNRSAGSPWPEIEAPKTPQEYLITCRKLLEGSKIRVALLDFSDPNPKTLRNLCGRFPNTRDYEIPGFVFGTAGDFKKRIDRKPSPLKLRAVYLDNSLHLAVVWAPLQQHQDTIQNLKSGIEIMLQIEEKKKLALLLREILPSLDS